VARMLGIDPGMSGGIAVLEGRRVVDAMHMPVVGDGSQREIDIGRLSAFIEAHEPDEAIIELVSAMPSIPGADGVRRGMGAASAFRFGFAVGQVRAVVACYRIPLTLVVPTVWKKHYGLKGGDKEPSRQMALRRFPEAHRLLSRKKDHGPAEAILIAAYGLDKMGLLAAA